MAFASLALAAPLRPFAHCASCVVPESGTGEWSVEWRDEVQGTGLRCDGPVPGPAVRRALL
eukprot:11090707-Alexandrium_andersonii.AAC.1